MASDSNAATPKQRRYLEGRPKPHRKLPLNRTQGPYKALKLLDYEGAMTRKEFNEQVKREVGVEGRFVLNELRKRCMVEVLVCITAQGRETLNAMDAYMEQRRNRKKRSP